MSILKVKDENGNWQGIKTVKGEKGKDGVSPSISVSINTNDIYKLRIDTDDSSIVTPNLKGQGGNGGTSVLGQIDNYSDFEGRRIQCVGTLTPLECFAGGTKYVFDHDVVMYVYNGDLDANDNMDIDMYTKYEGKEIVVPTLKNGFLTDYVIYNPTPRKAADDWVDPNLLNIVEDYGFYYPGTGISGSSSYKEIPDHDAHGDAYGTATYAYDKKYDMNRSGGSPVIKVTDKISTGVYNAKNKVPRLLEGAQMSYRTLDSDGEFSDPIPFTYRDTTYNNAKDTNSDFRQGMDFTSDYYGINLSCSISATPGCERIFLAAQNGIGKHTSDMILCRTGHGSQNLSEYGCTASAPIMWVTLKPNTNYTIESLTGDLGIMTYEGDPNDEAYCTLDERYVRNYTVNDEKVTVEDATITGKITTPCIYSSPCWYIKKGEKKTIKYTTNTARMNVLMFACYNVDDYQNIKIVEGTEAYTDLMSERLASGATKLKIKVCDNLGNDNLIAEHICKLYETSENNGYVRFMDNNVIKHIDLDDFAMNGHTHSVTELTDTAKLNIPKINLGTLQLTDGISELKSGEFYFVYKE